MSAYRALILVSMVVFALALSYALTYGILRLEIPLALRDLAKLYISTTFNPLKRELSAMTPEGVTAIVWDYRGTDTFFEIVVFYGAIIGSVALLGAVYRYPPGPGLSLIAKTVTRVVATMILVVGAAIALHGHLTPGGGFQGGATLAVSITIALVTFSLGALMLRGLTYGGMVALRSLGLIGIVLTVFMVVIAGLTAGITAYVFQNQPKPGVPIGMAYSVDGIVFSGTVWFLNVLDAIAVAAGFALLFIVLIGGGVEGERE